ncbi:MAG: paraquat-inducible protein A [Pseudomonadota bacterium]
MVAKVTLPAAKAVNLALLGLFPVAWQAPLATAEIPWLFSTETITVFSGIAQLYETDAVLAVLVGVFAIVAPYLKTLLLVYAQFSDTPTARALLPLIEGLARLSMTDVFLLGFYIIAYRGVGELQVQWGLHLFTALVLASIWASWETRRRRFETVPIDQAASKS